MILAGVDDAGRGSVLGPLVIAGVAIEESELSKLVELGVRDSKLLTPKRRNFLYKEIRKLASSTHEMIEPDAIDDAVINGQRLFRLNYLEATFMARVLCKLEFDLAYVDCCDTNQSRFGDLIADLIYRNRPSRKRRRQPLKLGEKNPIREKIRSEHHADRNYAVVSAASIIAKVTRDRAILRLHRKHGRFGSGYPSDPETLQFLKGIIANSEKLPPFTRMSWATIARLYGRPKIPRIDENY